MGYVASYSELMMTSAANRLVKVFPTPVQRIRHARVSEMSNDVPRRQMTPLTQQTHRDHRIVNDQSELERRVCVVKHLEEVTPQRFEDLVP